MRLLESLAALVLLALLAFGFANVVVRLVFGGGLVWYSDIARYALAWMVLLGAAAISFRGAHIAVDTGLVRRLPHGLERALGCIRFAAVAAFLAVLLVESVKLTVSTAPQTFITVRWLSLAWGYAALPVAAALMLLALVWRARRKAGPAEGGGRSA